MNRRTLTAVSCFAVALAAASTAAALRSPTHPAVVAAASATVAPRAASVARPVSDLRAHRFEAGAQARYQLHYEAEIRLGGPADPPVYLLSLDAGLDATVAAAGADGAELEYALHDLRFPASADPALARQASANLARPFRVRLDAAGAVRDLAFPQSTDAATRNTLRALAAGLQVVLPEARGAAWTAEETDPTGVYAADYRADAEGVTKVSRPYVRLSTPAGLAPAADIADVRREARTTLQLDADDRVTALTGAESLTLTMHQGVAPTYLKSALRLERTGLAAGIVLPVRPDFERVSLTEPLGATEMREADDQRRADKMPLAEAFSALREVEAEPDALAAASELNAMLAAKLRREPALAGRVAAEARKAGAGARAVLLSALSEAGTPEAQVALAGLAGDANFDARGRVEALGQLGLSEKPSTETLAALSRLSQSDDAELANTATLALGNAQRGATDPAALAALNEKLDAAQTPEARSLALTALGNTGAAEVLPALAAALDDADPEIRRAATFGIGNQKGAQALALLRGRLSGDESADVRVEAAHALGQRDPAQLAALAEDFTRAVQHDAASDVRAEALRALARLADGGKGDAAAIAVLRAVAESDPEDALRQAARRAAGDA